MRSTREPMVTRLLLLVLRRRVGQRAVGRGRVGQRAVEHRIVGQRAVEHRIVGGRAALVGAPRRALLLAAGELLPGLLLPGDLLLAANEALFSARGHDRPWTG